MPIDFQQFQGVQPYASELFGVYQPLIGWRSKRTLDFQLREVSNTIQAIGTAMARDSRISDAVVADKLPQGPDAKVPPKPPTWLNSAMGREFQDAVRRFEQTQGREPQGNEWSSVVGGIELERTVKAVAEFLTETGQGADRGDVVLVNTRHLTPAQLGALAAVNIPGTTLALVRQPELTQRRAQRRSPPLLVQTAIHAGLLDYLATKSPSALDALIANMPLWKLLIPWLDPLAQFDPETQDAILSPIGLIHIYRQYFFEFDSFLGPAVGHVWVSPGGSLELFEVHTRKTIEQRTIEIRTQTVSRSERELSLEDELATRVAKENGNSISFGVGLTAGVDFGVFQASAAASFGYNSAEKTAQSIAHSHSRKQSEKISNELRRDFKTTFRTSVETQDTSSRRYVLQNATNQVVNYEFRRKMRQVGVQVQHVATQLCWQVYVDDPGRFLGVSELVHIAKRGDLQGQEQPPEAPPALNPREEQVDVLFDFPGDEAWMDETFIDGKSEHGDYRIDHVKEFPVNVPGTGWTLAEGGIRLRDIQGTGADADQPSPVNVEFVVVNDHTFAIRLLEVNFRDNPSIRFFVSLIFRPPRHTKEWADYENEYKEYEQAKTRAAHEEYVRAVRDRVKLASNVEKRPVAELRAEERITVFERLISQLRKGAADETAHVTVELIRAIFDVDRMLYFVSESWWKPRLRGKLGSLLHPGHHQQLDGGTETLTPEDTVGWGGRDALHRDNYYITEDSYPAPLGASLGWLLQLDGDAHRNAFLNSPYVKAVIPIRAGKEQAAIAWLERSHVEGADGLDTPYRGSESEFQGQTIRQVLWTLAERIRAETATIENVLATETVYETGFDPLEGGFVANGEPFQIFDQWVEVLPTEQVVAVEYSSEGES